MSGIYVGGPGCFTDYRSSSIAHFDLNEQEIPQSSIVFYDNSGLAPFVASNNIKRDSFLVPRHRQVWTKIGRNHPCL